MTCHKSMFQVSIRTGNMSVLLEARSYRPFKSSEEYLVAMKEDLAEWLNALYPELRINVDNFMDRLDTGVALCKVSGRRKIYYIPQNYKTDLRVVKPYIYIYIYIKRVGLNRTVNKYLTKMNSQGFDK